MTPDLLDEGAKRATAFAQKRHVGRTESGGREAGFSRLSMGQEVDTTHGRILYLEDVSVSFDGFKAINKLSLDIAPGELRCIIGPNGAGKTTMMDVITGKTRPDSGTVFCRSARHPRRWVAGVGRGPPGRCRGAGSGVHPSQPAVRDRFALLRAHRRSLRGLSRAHRAGERPQLSQHHSRVPELVRGART